jgi:hypothetical protein
MGSQVVAPSVEVDTFASDVGVLAMLSLGLGTIFANAMLGGMLLVAAPALALYNKDKTEALVKRRALEIAPGVIRGVSAKVGPKIDEMVDEFAARLDGWVVLAGRELHQEVIEVLNSVKAAREAGPLDEEAERTASLDFEKQLGALRESLAARARQIAGERALGSSPRRAAAATEGANGASES